MRRMAAEFDRATHLILLSCPMDYEVPQDSNRIGISRASILLFFTASHEGLLLVSVISATQLVIQSEKTFSPIALFDS